MTHVGVGVVEPKLSATRALSWNIAPRMAATSPKIDMNNPECRREPSLGAERSKVAMTMSSLLAEPGGTASNPLIVLWNATLAVVETMPICEMACIQRIRKGNRRPYPRDREEVAYDYLPEEASHEEGEPLLIPPSRWRSAELGHTGVRPEQVDDAVERGAVC